MTGAGKSCLLLKQLTGKQTPWTTHCDGVGGVLDLLFVVPNAGYVMSIHSMRRQLQELGLVSVVLPAQAKCRTSASLPT